MITGLLVQLYRNLLEEAPFSQELRARGALVLRVILNKFIHTTVVSRIPIAHVLDT